MRRGQLKKEQENLHKSERLENYLKDILKKIQQMKIIIAELKRNINLDVIFPKNYVEEIEEIQNGSNITIRVENYEEGIVYYWTPIIFNNRYNLVKELFNKFKDEELDFKYLEKEDDPLLDEAKPILIGYSLYKLEPLSYLTDNPSELSIFSPNGNVIGKLKMDVFPHDEKGYEFDEVPESPSELIGECLQYKVCIYEVKNIPKNLANELKVEYQYFYDHSIISTKIYNKLNNNNGNNNYNNNNDKKNIDKDEKILIFK